MRWPLLAGALDTLSKTVAQEVAVAEWDTLHLLHWLRTSGIKVILIIGLALISLRLLYLLIARICDLASDGDDETTTLREQRAATLAGILRQAARVMILGISVMMILREFTIDIAPIIAGAGVLGVAIGFGAQGLVKDMIAGFFILMEGQFNVGDTVRGAGITGLVERMNLRITQLRDVEGVVHIIPNGEFRVVSNLTRGWSRAVLEIGVAYDTNLDRAMEALRGVGDGLEHDPHFSHLVLEPAQVTGVEALTDSSIQIQVLLKTRPGKHNDVAREFRKRVKERFEALGIVIPFPQRTLHISSPDAEAAGAARPQAADADHRRPAPGGASKET